MIRKTLRKIAPYVAAGLIAGFAVPYTQKNYREFSKFEAAAREENSQIQAALDRFVKEHEGEKIEYWARMTPDGFYLHPFFYMHEQIASREKEIEFYGSAKWNPFKLPYTISYIAITGETPIDRETWFNIDERFNGDGHREPKLPK